MQRLLSSNFDYIGGFLLMFGYGILVVYNAEPAIWCWYAVACFAWVWMAIFDW